MYKSHSEDSDQTGWMPRLIRVFAGCTNNFVCFVMLQLSLISLTVEGTDWVTMNILNFKELSFLIYSV